MRSGYKGSKWRGLWCRRPTSSAKEELRVRGLGGRGQKMADEQFLFESLSGAVRDTTCYEPL